jgi:hypothetical protein
MTTLKDGKGRGFSAGVNSSNRLLTNSVTLSEEIVAGQEGLSFAFSSQLVSFTSATASAILFLKNTSETDLIVDRARVMLGTVTGGTGDWTLTFLRNPTAGTIVTNALTAGITNVNHGSSQEPVGSFLRGVQGDTLTDGTGANFPVKSAGDNQLVFDLFRVLPTGASIGVRLTPPTGTTAATANVVLRAYYITE